ncbi:MAG TPA: hypothetical protein VHB98_11670 [Chloroflexota bacterium]|jgi:hypothetical protein|nr:hypothetical protein [Chloroflexota bacterium]
MSRSRDALVAVGMIVVIAGGYVYSVRPRASHAAVLRDLYASPLCLHADGTPRPRGPTVAQAWAYTVRTPIARARAGFVGLSTIELFVGPSGSQRYLSFIQAGPHRWRFNEDANTISWVLRVCGAASASGSS